MVESDEELKSLLMKEKEESEKAGLKLNIQKTKIMASGPIISWQIDGETMETVGSKITADGDCSHEIKRHVLHGRKALTRWTLVGKVMSLLFNMLSRLVIAFLPWRKHLSISWLQSPSAVILEPKKIKSVTVSIVSPSICHEVMGPDAMILVFRMLSFKSAFSLSSFTFSKLFSSSPLSAIRVICMYEIIGISLAILIPAYASSSLAFHMMHSAYKLNKQGNNIQP